jgi:hypothetical protein
VTLPEPVFTHLRRLTDDRGLFEHADHATPRPEHGYCVDDAARGVVVLCRAGDAGADDLLARYLGLVLDAVADDGRCHNRLGTDGRWQDEPGEGDWWGRAVWGLGTAAACPRLDSVLRERALAGFDRLVRRRPSFRRTLALAALGAAQLGTPSALALLADAAAAVRVGPASPWPEERLTYANGSLPEALIAAGSVLGRPDLTATGLEWLRFLVQGETRDGHFSVTPVGGRALGDRGPAFDQQPIEVSALADACARAYDATGDPVWADAVATSWRWFTGDNDAGVAMYEPDTGAGYDGLEPGGHNLNRGAESTLAALSVLVQARRIGATHDCAGLPAHRSDAHP